MKIKIIIADKDNDYGNKLSCALANNMTAKCNGIEVISEANLLNEALVSGKCDILLIDSPMYSELVHLDKVKCVIILANLEDPHNMPAECRPYKVIHKFQRVSDISKAVIDCFYFEGDNKDQDNCIFNSIQDGQSIDMVAFKTIQYSKPDFLFPVNMTTADTFRYDISDGNYVSLENFNTAITVSVFLSLFNNIITILIECGDWFMNYRCFYLDTGCVYIHKENYSVKLLYLPVEGDLYSEEAIIKNLMKIVRRINILDDEIVKLTFYELLADDNTLTDIKKALEAMMNDDDRDSGTSGSPPEASLPEPSLPEPSEEETANTDLLGVNMDTVLMTAPPSIDEDSMNTVLMTGGGMSVGTPKAALMYAGSSINAGLPKSINIELAGNSFTIGRRDKSKKLQDADFVFEHSEKTKTISRQHARIECHQGQYWIIDLQSTHGTFINKLRISANTRVKLNNYDKISFSGADIDYMFVCSV